MKDKIEVLLEPTQLGQMRAHMSRVYMPLQLVIARCILGHVLFDTRVHDTPGL